MSNKIMFVQCTPQELKELIQVSLKSELDALKNNFEKPKDDLLTREETCDKLKISKSTLWKWTKEDKIPCHRIGNRVYYKQDEIQACLTKSI